MIKTSVDVMRRNCIARQIPHQSKSSNIVLAGTERKTEGQGGYSRMPPRAAGIEGVATTLQLEQQPQHQLRQSRCQLRPSTTTYLDGEQSRFVSSAWQDKKKSSREGTRRNSATHSKSGLNIERLSIEYTTTPHGVEKKYKVY